MEKSRHHHHHHRQRQQQHQHQQQDGEKGSSTPSTDTAVTAGASCTSTDYPQLFVVFEFFTDNPQKSMPVDASSPQKDSPYYDPYWDAIRSMQNNSNFLEGILLRCVDCNPRYPFVHYIVYKSCPTTPGANATTTPPASADGRLLTPSPQPAASPTLNGTATTSRSRDAQTDLGVASRTGSRSRNHAHNSRQLVDLRKSHGTYRELHTFVDRQTPLLPKRPSNPNTAYIVSAFLTAGNLDSLDRSWSYWSGADYIVDNIPESLKLERITFHKVVQDGGTAGDEQKGRFSYVLLCELGEAMADLNRAREFIDLIKFRQCGVSSLYVIDHFF